MPDSHAHTPGELRVRLRLDVAPEFWEEVFDMEGSGRVRLIPAQLAGLALAFALSRVTLRALFAQVRAESGLG